MGNDHKPPQKLLDRLKTMWDSIARDHKPPAEQSSNAENSVPAGKGKNPLLRFSNNKAETGKQTQAEQDAALLVRDVRGILVKGDGKPSDDEKPTTPTQ